MLFTSFVHKTPTNPTGVLFSHVIRLQIRKQEGHMSQDVSEMPTFSTKYSNSALSVGYFNIVLHSDFLYFEHN